MIQFIKDLFAPQSTVSMMRVMSILCCLASIVIAFVGMNKSTPDYSGLSLLCSAFLGAAFAGKVAQKSIEAKTTPVE